MVDAEDEDDEQLVCMKLEDMSDLSIVWFEVQGKTHTLKEIKYVDSCVKVYSSILTLYT